MLLGYRTKGSPDNARFYASPIIIERGLPTNNLDLGELETESRSRVKIEMVSLCFISIFIIYIFVCLFENSLILHSLEGGTKPMFSS